MARLNQLLIVIIIILGVIKLSEHIPESQLAKKITSGIIKYQERYKKNCQNEENN